ncbi:hypothetical protein DYBT9275_03891 [Dyadobacter sp. CECT 9275]|uniref:Uncharacterized protein n=2 Tax=Dyadobacter helix TaxID=2822344 RepID=A0A916JEX2_9BACT|nr:hypothetical protein DYBT9275_03891 [Dyadobacter sp. CECT 9275]
MLLIHSGRLWFTLVYAPAANLAGGTAAVALMPELICQDEHLSKIEGDQVFNDILRKK